MPPEFHSRSEDATTRAALDRPSHSKGDWDSAGVFCPGTKEQYCGGVQYSICGMRTSTPLWCHIEEQISTLAGLYYRLMLVVGPSRSGKTTALRRLSAARSWPLVNVNLALSERLLELTSRQRAFEASSLLDRVAKERSGDVLLLDNTEILFDPTLRLDPLRVLQGIARHRSVIASWTGHYDDGPLTYAVPSHPEFRKYEDPDVVVVPTIST